MNPNIFWQVLLALVLIWLGLCILSLLLAGVFRANAYRWQRRRGREKQARDYWANVTPSTRLHEAIQNRSKQREQK